MGKKTRGNKRRLWRWLGGLFILLILFEVVGHYLAWRSGRAGAAGGGELSAGEVKRLSAENASLKKRLHSLAPRGLYIVIDSGKNTLYLKRGSETLRQAVVSCGSGRVLEEPGGRRRWVFDTPRGEFHVKTKIRNPYWIKPDWAFIEEGEEIPEDPRERVEPNVLGDYALGFGDGYFIHGTLYTRLLGRSVTHGCIRVGDEDLKILFERAVIGTKIYIY